MFDTQWLIWIQWTLVWKCYILNVWNTVKYELHCIKVPNKYLPFSNQKRNLDNIDFKKWKVSKYENASPQKKLIKYRSKELSDTVFVIEEFYYCNFILRQIIKWNVNISLWSVSEVLNALAIFGGRDEWILLHLTCGDVSDGR